MADINEPIQTGPGGVPLVEPTSDINAAVAGQLGAGIKPADKWQKFWAQANLNLMDAPIGLGTDMAGPGAIPRFFRNTLLDYESQAAGHTKLTPTEANTKYPGLPQPFTEPVAPEVAQVIFDDNQKRQRLQAWISRGPETGLAFDLATGLAPGLDPLNIALGAILGAGSKALGLARNISTIYAENLAANLAGEVPGLIQKSREQQTLPTATEVVGGAAQGAVLGTGLHFLIKKIFGRAEKSVKNEPESKLKKSTDGAIKLHESGNSIDVAPQSAISAVRNTGHAIPGVDNPYTYRTLEKPTDASYYVPIDADTGKIKTSIDGGIEGSDNPQWAHNQAGTPESEFNGKVVRAEISPDAKILDASTAVKDLSPEERKILLESFSNEEKLQITAENPTLQVVLDELPDGAKPVKAMIQEMGYDGMKYNGILDGKPLDNRIMVFNDRKINPAETVNASKASVPAMDAQTERLLSERSQSPENARYNDQALKQELAPGKLLNDSEVKLPEIDQQLKDAELNARAYLEDLYRQNQSPELRDAIDQIDRDFENDKLLAQGAKLLAKCLTENKA